MTTREKIARHWLDRIARSYGIEPARFAVDRGDRFRDPVGQVLRDAVPVIVEEILGDMDHGRVAAALESVVKIRAVQNLTPAQALAFLFDLKEIVRQYAPDASPDVINPRVDSAALKAFDLYMGYREKTYDVRLNEARRRLGIATRGAT